jgi:hypothetical protein
LPPGYSVPTAQSGRPDIYIETPPAEMPNTGIEGYRPVGGATPPPAYEDIINS